MTLPSTPSLPGTSPTDRAARVASVDILRGVVMVIMALDHVRDFFSNVPFEPEDITQTYPLLFYTRWITHFCAPLFFFLAGVGGFFLLLRRGNRAEVSRFLWTRGLWLVVLELTLIGFAWTFVVPWGMAGVIWALGWSMVILAGVIRLPVKWIAALSVATIALHDLADTVAPAAFGPFGWLWRILHVKGIAAIPVIHTHFFVLFPLIPWVAVMCAGFAFGRVLTLARAERRRWMLGIGWTSVCLFALLRGFNSYGNPSHGLGNSSPGPWHVQPTAAMTLVSFLDVEKYPPSLQFLLMTLGLSLLIMSWLDGLDPSTAAARVLRPILLFGRVPLFFYVLHLFLIHIAAIAVGVASHQPVGWLLHGGFFLNEQPETYGHGLGIVYVVWASVIGMLYYPCRWFSRLKQRRHDWWLSYL